MRLAAHHRWVDVDAMLDSISPRQFTEWWAADKLDGVVGEVTLWTIVAQGLALLCNAWGGKLEPKDLYPPEYVPTKQRKRQQAAADGKCSPEQGAAIFGAWAAVNIPGGG